MRLLGKNENFDLFKDDFFNTFDYPYSITGKNAQLMKTDIIDEKDSYIYKIDIPGVEKENIKIHLGDNYLTIFVKKNNEEEYENEKYVHQERFYTSLSRCFYVGDVKEEDIKASYKNGTLTLKIPKVSKEKERKFITIE